MSDTTMKAPGLSLLDQLRMQNAQFVQQKTFAESNLNQLVGAIYACDIMIKKHEEEASKLQLAGDQGNGEADSEQEKQTSKE